MLQFFRMRYMPFWPMWMKFKQIGQRNTLVFALTVRWLWKPFRLPKHLPWYKSAKRHWISLPGTLYWVPGQGGVWGNKTAYKFARDSSVQEFVGPELSFGVSRQNIKRKIKCWTDKQHLVMWRGFSSTQGQAQKQISGPSPTTKTRFLSFTGHNPRSLLALLLDIIPREEIFT